MIDKIPPDQEDSIRSEGVESSQSSGSLHRRQASSRNSPTRPRASEALQGSSRPAPPCPPRPSPSPPRQRGSPRFVATPAVDTVPDAQQGLAGQSCTSDGACTRGNGGDFAPLEALCRRVAGVSRLYWRNSPRLVAPSTWAKLNRAPLTAQVPIWWRSARGFGWCGAQSADHLGEKR